MFTQGEGGKGAVQPGAIGDIGRAGSGEVTVLGEVGELEGLLLDPVARPGQALGDVVGGRLVAGGPGRAAALYPDERQLNASGHHDADA